MSDSSSTQYDFPRAQRLQVGYSALEDRVILRMSLASGGGCTAWLPRRLMVELIQRINAGLKRSHPAGEGRAAYDEVLALEHMAARAELSGQRYQTEADQDSDAEETAGQAQAGSARGAAGGAAEQPDSSDCSEGAEDTESAEHGGGFYPSYLVTKLDVEVRDSALLIGFSGHLLPAEPGILRGSAPVVGVFLTRNQAHEVLHMLSEQSKQAEWGLPRSVSWLRRLLSK